MKDRLIELTSKTHDERLKLTVVYLLTKATNKPSAETFNQLSRQVANGVRPPIKYSEHVTYNVLEYVLHNIDWWGFPEEAVLLIKSIERTGVTPAYKDKKLTVEDRIFNSKSLTITQKLNELAYLSAFTEESNVRRAVKILRDKQIEELDTPAQKLEQIIDLGIMDEIAEEVISRYAGFGIPNGLILNNSLAKLDNAHRGITYGLQALLYNYTAKQSPEYQALIGTNIEMIPIVKDYRIYTYNKYGSVILKREKELLTYYEDTGMLEEAHLKSLKQLLTKLNDMGDDIDN